MRAPDTVACVAIEHDPARVLLSGHGTLLCRDSLGHTIGQRLADDRAMMPVLVHGFRRLFNLRPDHYDTSNLWGRPGVEQGGLNVEPAAGALLNGLAFRVAPEELEKLDRREYVYDRLRVETEDFETGELVGPGYIYSSRPDARWIERDPDGLLPRWSDMVRARAGAYAIGHRFGETFDRTTYLANGETLVVDRYRDHLSPGEPPRDEEPTR